MSISISPEVAALLGALIGSIPTLIAAQMNNRVRAREQMREIAVRAAIEGWRFNAEHGAAPYFLPLEHSIFHAAKMSEIAFSDEKITPEQLSERLKEISALVDALTTHAASVGVKAR